MGTEYSLRFIMHIYYYTHVHKNVRTFGSTVSMLGICICKDYCRLQYVNSLSV
jgi:hypothetical protein